MSSSKTKHKDISDYDLNIRKLVPQELNKDMLEKALTDDKEADKKSLKMMTDWIQ